MKIPQFLGFLGGRLVRNILVATQPLVSVWELLMGNWENGEIANSSSPSPAAVHQCCEREKAYRGEKVTLEKKGLGVTCILLESWCVAGCQCAV